MACFVVTAVEAAVVSVATRVIEKRETKLSEGVKLSSDSEVKLNFSHKLKWLNNMLWGGSALLAFEHVWHGEVVPFFPFLTNAINPADRIEMLHEMATSGVAMAVLVTAVWAAMVAVSAVAVKNQEHISEVG
jgi:hypothetical protein